MEGAAMRYRLIEMLHEVSDILTQALLEAEAIAAYGDDYGSDIWELRAKCHELRGRIESVSSSNKGAKQ
jgi:hypothetical protein